MSENFESFIVFRSSQPNGNDAETLAQSDPVLRAQITNMISFAATLSQRALAEGLTQTFILDFGGGVGLFSRTARWALPGILIDYHVVELPHVCEIGRGLRPDVAFHSELSTASRRFDFVLASGSLQYVKDWRGILRELVDRTERTLMLSRLPIVQTVPSFVIAQKMPTKGHSYGWAWNAAELIGEIESHGLAMEPVIPIQDDYSTIAGAAEQPVVRALFAPRTRSPSLD